MSAAAIGPTEKRRRLPPEERRAQLLEIAIDVFADRGLGAARHAEIAERAGVAVSTVFAYFETREALVDAVLDEVADFFLQAAGRVHGQDKGCVEILREVGDALVDFLHTHRSVQGNVTQQGRYQCIIPTETAIQDIVFLRCQTGIFTRQSL